MRGVVRTGIDATRFGVIVAKIARSRFHLHGGHFASGVRRIIQLYRERVHVDVPVRTVAGAQSTANTPVFDNDFERIAPANGADRTAHHAKRIATLPAGGSHQILVESKTFPHQTAHALMRISTGPNTHVAARAALQIEQQKALRFHQSLRQELVNGHAAHALCPDAIALDPLLGHTLQSSPYFGEAVEHHLEVFAREFHHLDVVEG